MNYRYLIVLLIFGVSLSCGNQKEEISKKSQTIIVPSEQWQKINSLKEKGMQRAAVQELNQILQSSAEQEDYETLFKALALRSKFIQEIDEQSADEILESFHQKIQTSKLPGKQILQSALAELYLQYLQSHQWQIKDRSSRSSAGKKVLSFMSAGEIKQEAKNLYLASLIAENELNKLPLKEIEKIYLDGEDDSLFLTHFSVYDFLVKRAIDHFENEAIQNDGLNLIAEDSMLFADANTFINIDWFTKSEGKDVASWLGILSNALKIHQNKKEKEAFHYFNILRLKGTYRYSTHEEKYALFKKFLEKEIKESTTLYQRDELRFELASHFYQKEKYEQAIEVCNACEQTNSYGSNQCSRLRGNIETVAHSLNTELVYPSNREILFSYQYKNLDSSFFKIVKLEEKEVFNLNFQKEQLEEILNRNEVVSWNQQLQNWTDYKAHRSELMSSGLKCGDYLLIVSDRKDFNVDSSQFSASHFKVSDIAFLERKKKDGGVLYSFKNRLSGKALEGAKIILYAAEYDSKTRSNEWKPINELIADKEGRVLISSEENPSNLSLRIEHKEQYLIPNGRIYLFRQNRNQNTRKYTDFFTDRSIYRAGQTVYFKGILYSSIGGEEKTLENEKCKVSIYDPRGEELKNIQLTTNQFGSVTASFILPKDLLNGRYRLANEYGSINFRVEDYRRPSLVVNFDSNKFTYVMGDTVCVSGTINSYTGLAINNTKIDFQVIRKNLAFPRPYYSSYIPLSKSSIIKSGSLELTDNQFEICFPTVTSKKAGSSFHYEVVLNVTDPLGENLQESKNIIIGQIPYSLKSDCPENINLERLNNITITAEDINAKSLVVQGIINLWSLKEPNSLYLKKYWPHSDHHLIEEKTYQKTFPKISIGDQWQLSNMPKDVKLSSIAFQAKEKLNSFRDLEEGAYLLEAISIAENGDTVKLEKRFRFFKESSRKVPYPTFYWSQLEKEEIKKGDKIKIQLNTSLSFLELQVELESNGKTLQKQKVSLSNEKRWLEFNSTHAIGHAVLHISGIAEGRSITERMVIRVFPKEESFKLHLITKKDLTKPGSNENWVIGIKNLKKDEKIELLASVYDRSLDQLEKQEWQTHFKWDIPISLNWEGRNNFGSSYSRSFQFYRRYENPIFKSDLPYLNWFGFYMRGGNRGMPIFSDGIALGASPDKAIMQESNVEYKSNQAEVKAKNQGEQLRNDFRETVFFYPQISNKGDEIELEFTMPDALTGWRFRAIAHNKSYDFHQIDHTFISRKELMVKSYFPRFYRVKDRSSLVLEVRNTSDTIINGLMGIKFTELDSKRELDLVEGDKEEVFNLSPGASQRFTYTLKSPDKPMQLKYQLYAKGENHSDIEEGLISILPSSILLTESYPFELKAGEKKSLNYKRFAQKQADVKRNRSYKVEYSADPRWLAVLALPSMLKEQDDNPEMVFSTLYANSLAKFTANKLDNKDKLRLMIKSLSPLSQLDQNEDVKPLKIESTPWLSVAREERDQRALLARLFDENQIKYELKRQLDLLSELQLTNGAWPWFKGMNANLYITQYISAGLGKLALLNAFESPEISKKVALLLSKAYEYLDEEIMKKYSYLKERGINEKQDYLSPTVIHYLYARSFDKNWKPNAAAAFYLQQSEQFWYQKNALLRSQIALAYYQMNINNELAPKVISSLKDIGIRDSLGIHWKTELMAPYWYQSPIETQAYIIELYQKANPADEDIMLMKKWLLHQKKQQYWQGNTIQALASYVLLKDEKTLLTQSSANQLFVGNEAINQPSSGMPAYISKSWSEKEINASLAEINIAQEENTFGWGAAYWQYYEEIDKVKDHSKEGLKIQSEYYLYKINQDGKEELAKIEMEDLEVGDLIKQRTEIWIDYDLDFVLISDQPPACLESTEVKSGMRYQDGAAYYMNIKDSERQMFIDHLKKGRYVFEADYRISHSGEFKGGVCKLQSMYAPDFVSHSTAGGLKIK